MTDFVARAPGKLMLFGEHAVVYGRPCLVTTVGLYVSAKVARVDDPTVQITTPALRARAAVRTVARATIGRDLQPETAFVEAAVAQVQRLVSWPGGLRIDTDGPLLSYGLGSSSAVTVAVVAALGATLGLQLSPRMVFDLAYGAVLAAQGKGSGFDVAAAVYGGTLWYETGGVAIEPLSVPELPFRIGYSGAKVSTRRFVDRVDLLRARHAGLVEHVFDDIASIVQVARPALEQGDWQALGELMDVNQGLLDALGVSTLSLAELIFATREAGALGAKLSGAGGGDCMFALAPADRRVAIDAAIAQAGTLVELPLGVPGVVVTALR